MPAHPDYDEQEQQTIALQAIADASERSANALEKLVKATEVLAVQIVQFRRHFEQKRHK